MLNLGTLQFTLGIDTRALDAAKGRVAQFGNVVAGVQAKANRGLDAQIAPLRRIENTVLKAGEMLNKLTAQIQNSKLTPELKVQQINNANRAFNQLTKNIVSTKNASDATRLDRGFAAYTNTINGASRSVAQLSAEQKRAETAASATAVALGRQEARLGTMAERARNLAQQIELSALGEGVKIGLADKVQAEMTRMRSLMSGPAPLDPTAFRRAGLEYNATIGNISREFRKFKTEANVGELGATSMRKMRESLQNLGSTMLLVNGHLGGMSTRFIALSTLVGNLGVGVGVAAGALVGLGVGLSTIVGGALRTELQLEKARKALTALTGTYAAANVEFNKVIEISDRAGLSLEQLTQSYSKYYAASTSAGQSVAATRQQFNDIAVTAGTLGLTVEDTAGVFRAFEQMLSKGTVQAEELRNQLGDRFPGAFQIAAKAMNVTTRELSDMTKKGEVFSREFIPKFIETMKVAYNIQADKPIDTLQAALNRGSNAVTLFFDAFNRSTKVVEAAKVVVGAFASVLNSVSANMDVIVRGLVGFTGAVVGATTAWLALRAAILVGSVLPAMIAWIGSLIGLLRVAKSATDLWALAQVALNTAMLANPVGAILGLLARLAIVIGGAVFGYKQLTGMLDQSNNSFASGLSNINQYITQQKAMGAQVRSTTMELLRQAAVLAKTKAAELRTKLAEYKSASSGGVTIMDTVKSLGSLARPVDIYRKRVGELRAEVVSLTNQTKEATKGIVGLGEVAKLPELGSNVEPFTAGGDEEKGGKKGGKSAAETAAETAEKVRDLTKAYYAMLDAQQAIKLGVEGLKAADAFDKAKEVIATLNTQELSVLDGALTKAGFTTGTLTQRLAEMNLATDRGAESINAFKSAWEEIDKVKGDLDALTQKMNYFAETGSSDFTQIDNLNRALQMTKNLSADAVNTLLDKFSKLGIILIAAENPAKSLALTLANFFDQVSAGEDATKTVADFGREMDELNRKADEADLRIQGLLLGLTGANLDAWVQQKQAVKFWTTALEAAGLSAEQVAKKIAELKRVMGVGVELDAQARKLEESAQAWTKFKNHVARNAAEAAGAIVKNFRSIEDALGKLVEAILNMVIELLIVAPIYKALKVALGIPDTYRDGGLVKGYAAGGFVSGPGTSRSDSVPARLSAGEFVMSAAAVRTYGVSTLEAMNSGKGAVLASRDQGGPMEVMVGLAITPNEMFDVKMQQVADDRIEGAAPQIVRTSVMATKAAASRQTITGR